MDNICISTNPVAQHDINTRPSSIKYMLPYNKGEFGEILCINNMYNLIHSNPDKIKNLLGLHNDEIVELIDVQTHLPINGSVKKAPARQKADCCIKVGNRKIFISIKTSHGANPSVINHTPRSAKVFQDGGDLNYLVDNLDHIVISMNMLRNSDRGTEDIKISQLEKLISAQESALKEVISYFVFDGTGQYKANYTINGILCVNDPTDITTWSFFDCPDRASRLKYIDMIYPKLILSMRDKGMPKDEYRLVQCRPWIFESNGKSKGSLHVRMSTR